MLAQAAESQVGGGSAITVRPTAMPVRLSTSSARCGSTGRSDSTPSPARWVTLQVAGLRRSVAHNARACTGAEPMLVTIAESRNPPDWSQVTSSTIA